MEYRNLPHGGEPISILGLGSSALGPSGDKEIQATAALAVENGINYFDLASADAVPFTAYGKALAASGRRCTTKSTSGRTTKPGSTAGPWIWRKSSVPLTGSSKHCAPITSTSALSTAWTKVPIWNSTGKRGVGLSPFLTKARGVRHIGLSSHTPEVAQQVLDWKLIDMLMFSINPAYDYQQGEYANGSASQRMALYRRCEAEGVGISVMKAFSGGQLLDAKISPFRQALTEYQCLAYALDKPGVLTVLPGVRNRKDLKRLLAFWTQPLGRRTTLC